MRLRIVGGGEVGLATAAAAIERNHEVEIVEISGERREALRKLLPSHQLLIRDAPSGDSHDATLLCVPTRSPDDTFDSAPLLSAIAAIGPVLSEGEVVCVDSTIPPFTTLESLKPALERSSGRVVGRDVFLVHAPERIDSTIGLKYREIPRVVGGVTPSCTAAGVRIYRELVENVHPVESATVAEWTKVLENAFRFTNVAFINEFASALLAIGVDPRAVVTAAATKPFGFLPFWPSAGVGGACVPLATRFYFEALQRSCIAASLTAAAIAADAALPGKLASALRLANGSRVLIVGTGYKTGSSQLDGSPALRLAEHLRAQGNQVTLYDPSISKNTNAPIVREESGLEDAYDCAIICARISGFAQTLQRRHIGKTVDLSGASGTH